ncbi:MAG: ATP-binding cassette domain-containing protein, partial [Acidobacteriaceae bacterium]
ANKMFGKLSGGQKQRTLFALALCGNPDLIFLDDPTVGMDIESRRGLWDQVRALSAAGKTVLLTTHYLEEADLLASRIVVINKGKLRCEGTPAEIKHRVSGRRIRCITQLAPEFLQSLPSVSEVQHDREAVVILAEHPERVVREMLLRDESLHGLEISAAALEDAFLALTSDASTTN